MLREILHCDMNNFYASVECMLDPTLKDYPIAVCGSVEERHGIVLAKNYKAKAYKVQTGDAVWQAKNKCPNLIVVAPHYDEYMKYSKYAREIYLEYTDLVECYGMDECWLDVTASKRVFGDGEKIANEIRERIKFELGLTISVGVSFNKIFAKLGSDMKKPDAVTVIPYSSFREKIFDLPASDLLGVGRSTKRILDNYCIYTIGNLANTDVGFLQKKLGKNGIALWNFANGFDRSIVSKNDFSMPVKSVGHGTTTTRDLTCCNDVWVTILQLSVDIGRRLRKYQKDACGVSVSVRDCELNVCQFQTPLEIPTQSNLFIAKKAYNLFEKRYDWHNPIRSITITAITLIEHKTPYQLNLFFDARETDKREKIDLCIDKLESRFGNDIVKSASLCLPLDFPASHPTLTMPTGMVN